MADPKAAVRGKAVGIDLELVILRGHGDPACPQIEHRMVPAMMTEPQSRGAGAGRLPDQLMAEANTQHRQAPDELPGHRNCGLQLRRIPRPVGDPHAVGPPRTDRADTPAVTATPTLPPP